MSVNVKYYYRSGQFATDTFDFMAVGLDIETRVIYLNVGWKLILNIFP
jgi:hypothetical protein